MNCLLRGVEDKHSTALTSSLSTEKPESRFEVSLGLLTTFLILVSDVDFSVVTVLVSRWGFLNQFFGGVHLESVDGCTSSVVESSQPLFL